MTSSIETPATRADIARALRARPRPTFAAERKAPSSVTPITVTTTHTAVSSLTSIPIPDTLRGIVTIRGILSASIAGGDSVFCNVGVGGDNGYGSTQEVFFGNTNYWNGTDHSGVGRVPFMYQGIVDFSVISGVIPGNLQGLYAYIWRSGSSGTVTLYRDPAPAQQVIMSFSPVP